LTLLSTLFSPHSPSSSRFATGKFSGIRRPTIGSDFLTKKMEVHEVEVSLQIWDTAGQERFQTGSLGSTFYRGSHGALLVYDVNNEKSQEQIEQWRDDCLSRQEGEEFFPIVVIGNKTDLRDAKPQSEWVDQTAILTWCRDNSYGHIETSAKDGHGVDAAMMAITGLALECKRTPRRSETVKGKVNLNNAYEKKSKGFCEGCM
jgi:Ras-related protein Rab-7A